VYVHMHATRFESRQEVSFLGFLYCNAVLCNLIGIVILFTYLSEINVKKYFFNVCMQPIHEIGSLFSGAY
jgi:CTP:phosphocholine cytidylyltransferase-like protein